MAQIFLSYSRQDAEAAKTLATRLSAAGHKVWWDKNISGGSAFAAEIEEALTDADIVMVLWSNASVKSPWVLDEAGEGRDSGRLLPVALDHCRPPLGFRQFQAIGVAAAAIESAVEEILQAVGRKSDEKLGTDASHPRSATDTNPVETHCATARQLAEDGDYDAAQQEVDAALAIDPDSWEANREAARLLYTQGRADDAIRFCEKAVAAMRHDHESASLLISCCRATRNETALKRAADLAVARAEQSIASGSNVGSAFASGAKGLAALGHRERARKWVRKALNVDPGNLAMRYTIAATLAAFLDDGDAGVEVLEPFVEHVNNRAHLQLLETDPDWSSVRERREFKSLLARARKRIEALESTG